MKQSPKLILLLIPLLLAACKKDEMKLLPDATQTGANTMGVIVNDKAWEANGGTGFQPAKPVDGGYLAPTSFDKSRHNVIVESTRKNGTGFQIYLRDVSKPGEYLLSTTTNLFGGELRQPQNYGAYYIPGKLYMTTSRYTGKVIITRADTVNKIVSGIFAFKAEHGKDTVTITNGRFDVSTF